MKQRYIIGDVVEYDNKVMVIKEPRDGSHFDLSSKEGLVYCLVDVDEIKPVRITPEILEKNGWNLDNTNHYINNYNNILLVKRSNKYSVYKIVYDTSIWLASIRSISDLQHFLFGLGINHEMEV